MIKGLPREPHYGETVSLDIELFKMGPRLHRPTGSFACLSIAYSKDEVYQVQDTTDLRRALEILDPASWVFHNSLFDIFHLRRFADIRRRPVWDTMLVEQDMWGGYYDSFSLDALTRRYLGIRMSKEQRKAFEGAESMTPEMEEYAALDAVATIQIAQKQSSLLHLDADPLPCYFEIDHPAMWAALDMKPIRVDVDGWLALAGEHEQTAEQIKDYLGFNPGSVPQTKKALKEATGRAPSDTRKETLLGLYDEGCEIAKQIMDYRRFKKAASSYGRKWIDENVEDGDLVYSGWRITGAETGRMSSRSPNLQNIPARTMPKFRSLFLPHKGETLVVSDVAAQEPRIAAWWSKDEALLEALKNDEDVYAPAMEAAGVERDPAKVVFLGLLYDLSEHGLAHRLRCTKPQARTIMRKVLGKHKGIAVWKSKAKAQAYKRGYALTPTGRKVWLNPYTYQWERNAVNAPIQGGAADQTKAALSELHKQDEYHVCMVVHDEIVASAPLDKAEKYGRLVEAAWIEAGSRVIPGVPIKADVKIGPNWGIKQLKEDGDDDDEE